MKQHTWARALNQWLAESMWVAEHPANPLAISVRLELTQNFPFARCTQGWLVEQTAEILHECPELMRHWVPTTRTDYTSVPIALSPEEVARIIWSDAGTSSREKFDESPLFADSVPPLRLRLTPEDGLHLRAHHSMLDARAAFVLIFRLLTRFTERLSGEVSAEAFWPGVRLMPPSTAADFPRVGSFLRLRGLGLALGKLWSRKFRPAFLFSTPTAYVAEKNFLLSHPMDVDWLEAKVKVIREMEGHATSLEVLLTAFQRALRKLALARGVRRPQIRTLVAMDGWAGTRDKGWWGRPLANFAMGTSVSSRGEVSLESIRRQVRRYTRPLFIADIFGVRPVLELLFLRRTRFYREAFRHKFEKGMPYRMRQVSGSEGAPDPLFGRMSDTALFSSTGRFDIPAAIAPYIVRMYAHTPGVNPMGITLAYIHHAKGTLGLTFSDTGLTQQEGELLLSEMLTQIEVMASASVGQISRSVSYNLEHPAHRSG